MTDRPFARPPASTHDSASRLHRAVSPPLRATNDGAHSGTIHPPVQTDDPIFIHSSSIPRPPVSNPVASTSGTRLAEGQGRVRTPPEVVKQRLSERDLKILGSVAVHGFMTSHHITQFHFDSHVSPPAAGRAARRVLERLRRDRILGVLDRRIGGVRSGSSGLVYFVDVVGDRVLRVDAPTRPRRRFFEPSARFLEHTLAIVDAHLAAVLASRRDQFELVDVAIEKQAWRPYVGLGGGVTTLKPDLALVTATDDYEDHWWIEIDRGHESLRTVLRKCADYELYRRSGHEQSATGVFPRILWVMSAADPDKAERRRQSLRRELSRDRSLQAELFAVIDPSAFVTTLQSGVTP